jgi:hypothetical protein
MYISNDFMLLHHLDILLYFQLIEGIPCLQPIQNHRNLTLSVIGYDWQIYGPFSSPFYPHISDTSKAQSN